MEIRTYNELDFLTSRHEIIIKLIDMPLKSINQSFRVRKTEHGHKTYINE